MMGIEAQPTTTTNSGPATGAAAVNGAMPPSPAASPIPATPSAPMAPAIPAQATPVPAQQALPPQPTRRAIGDDDEIPNDVEVVEMNKSALKTRLERHSKSQLRQLFGTDNPEEIIAWKTRAEEAAKREEEARLAQMTEAERYKVQFEKSTQEATNWKTKYAQLRDQYEMREQDRRVTSIASRHVDPDCIDYVSRQLAEHLAKVDGDQIQEPEQYIDQWIKDYVTQHPKFGMAQPVQAATPALAPAAPAAPVQPRRVPVHNGPGGGAPSQMAPTGPVVNKTAAPGHANSMSDDEWRRFKRENGLDF